MLWASLRTAQHEAEKPKAESGGVFIIIQIFMKRILFFVMIVSITTSLFAQTRYNDGFKNGYKEGYCHDKGVGCVPPNPPIAPTPQIGEDFNSYQDGYNRGFKMGTQANTSSKQTSGRQQYLDHDKPQFVDDFVYKPNYKSINTTSQNAQAMHYEKVQYIQSLVDWIERLEKSTNDDRLLSKLKPHKARLELVLRGGLVRGATLEELKNNEVVISEIVNDYIKMVEKENDPNRYWELANKHFEKKEYQSAIDNYNKVIQLSPDFAPAYFQRGFSYANLNNSGGAMKDFSKYIQLEPQEPSGYAYRGLLLFNQANYTDAISDFTKALQLQPNDLLALSYRGMAKYYNKDYISSMTDFSKVIDLDPTNINAYSFRGTVKDELKDYNGALNDMTKAIELAPNNSMVYNNRGWAKFELKKYNEALIDVNKAIELDDKNATAYDSRAEIKFNLNDYKGCIEDCDKALSLNSQISNAYFIKGRATYRLGNKEKACEYWSKAGEIGKADAFEYIAKYCNK